MGGTTERRWEMRGAEEVWVQRKVGASLEKIFFCFWREVCYSSPLMLGKRREDTAKAVHAQRPTTKRRRQGSLSSF